MRRLGLLRLEYRSGMVSEARFDKSLWRPIETLLLPWTSWPSWLPITAVHLRPYSAQWRVRPPAACWTRWPRAPRRCCRLFRRWREDWLWAGRGRREGGEGGDVGRGEGRGRRACWVRDERLVQQLVRVGVERLLEQGCRGQSQAGLQAVLFRLHRYPVSRVNILRLVLRYSQIQYQSWPGISPWWKAHHRWVVLCQWVPLWRFCSCQCGGRCCCQAEAEPHVPAK